MGRLGVSGFTTALPPIAAFVPRQRLHACCSRCRRLRSSAKRSQWDASVCQVLRRLCRRSQPSCLGSGYVRVVAAAEGCVRARSGRTMGRLGVSGFTTALPPIAAFVPRQRLHACCSRCRRLRSSAKRSHNGTPRCVRFTTALPPIADFVPRQRLHACCSRCRRLRSSAKRSHHEALGISGITRQPLQTRH